MTHEHPKPIIQSVRALAEAQLAWAGSEDGGSIEFEAAVLAADFPALLAALERAERIEKAARAVVEDTRNSTYEDCCVRKGLVCEVLAALSEPK